jgi:hypothetical protein
VSSPSPKTILLLATLVLVIVSYLGMTGSLPFSDQAADEAEAAAMAEQVELNAQFLQEQLSDRLAEQANTGKQARLDSPLGQALFRQCLEWTEFHENHPSDMSLENRDNACNEFRIYVRTGTEPE